MQVSLWLLWKGQSTILALLRRRILGQYPAATCSPGPFGLLLKDVILGFVFEVTLEKTPKVTSWVTFNFPGFGRWHQDHAFGMTKEVCASAKVFKGESSGENLLKYPLRQEHHLRIVMFEKIVNLTRNSSKKSFFPRDFEDANSLNNSEK